MSGTDEPKAARACATCRTQKRKCDKKLPVCSLCQKSRRPCHYLRPGPNDAAASSSETPPPLNSSSQPCGPCIASPSDSTGQSSPGHLTDEPGHSTFPSAFFLDYSTFKLLGTALPDDSDLSLPPRLASCVGSPAEIRHKADIYFHSTHGYFPVVSKLRFYQELSAPATNVSVNTALLVTAMQLHTSHPGNQRPDRHPLYDTLKTSLHLAGGDMYSIRHLQANILMALYEVAHAIYPAAYLTIGHCVRLGHLLGIHSRKGAPQLLKDPSTSTDVEERRRVWWGVLILDRYVNLGGCGRPLGCVDVSSNDFLPADDRCWDRGELTILQPLVTAANIVDPVSPFARTCQASHLLSCVLRQVSNPDGDNEFSYTEAIQLHRTIRALFSVIDNEIQAVVEKAGDVTAQLPLLPAAGLCFSGLLSLYEQYSCPENSTEEQRRNTGWVEMQRLAISGLTEISAQVAQLARVVKTIADLGGIIHASPFMSDCLYHAAANYVWFIHENGNQEYQALLSVIKEALGLLGTRWKAPRDYMQLLTSGELHLAKA